MEIKKLTKEQLNEALKPIIIKEDVTGDKAAARTASAQDKVEKVKRRIEKRAGVTIPELDNIFTLEQLAIEPFYISFNIQVPEPKETNLNKNFVQVWNRLELASPIGFSSVLAGVDEIDPFTLIIKDESGDFKIRFNNDILKSQTLTGTKKKVPALKTSGSYSPGKSVGKKYDVQISKNFFESVKKKKNRKKRKKEKNPIKIEVGKEYFYHNKKGTKNVVKVVSLTNSVLAGDDKEFLTNDDIKKQKLNNPNIVFVVFKKSNNTYGAGPALAVEKNRLSEDGKLPTEDKNPTVEYFINSISKNILLLKEENDQKNQKQNKIQKEKYYNATIYLGVIELGAKAKESRKIDISNYQKSVGGGSSNTIKKVNGLKVSDLPSKSGLIKVRDLRPTNNPNLSTEQTNLMKFISNTIKSSSEVGLRKSVSDPKTTFILEYPNKKALVCKVSNFTQDLTKPYIKITIGQKAGGDALLNGVSINAEISFEFLS